MKEYNIARIVRLALFNILIAAILTIRGQAQLPQSTVQKLKSLQAEKAARTPAQRKMDSQLIYAVKMARNQAIANGVETLRVDLDRDASGRVKVDIDANVTPELVAEIVRNGGEVINSVPAFNAIRAWVRIDQTEVLAARNDVKFIKPAVRALNNVGSVTSEGDATHLAAAGRAQSGSTGAGVKVGVLSDSVDHLQTSQSLGDLGQVTVLPGQGGTGIGEGTAMLEIVHDLAPDSSLYFATAHGSPAVFAQNILALAQAGCSVIVDDVIYADESPFQDGVIARAVNTVTAAGVLYFSSAGNSGNKNDGESGTWEGDFRDSGQTIEGVGRIHDFGGGAVLNEVTASGLQGLLFWSDPLGASANDYDIYLLDANGNLVASSTNPQDGTQDPYEQIPLQIGAGELVFIALFSGEPRFLHFENVRGHMMISTAGNIRGHSCAADAFAVAATPAGVAFGPAPNPRGPYPNPFSGANPVERFSSDGPRRVFFEANGTPITPGNFLATGGRVRQKPDLTAADGVKTSFPSNSGLNPFFGTSAAAPHAAAITALVKSQNPNRTPAQMRSLLINSTIDIEAPGVDQDSGYGILMADRALGGTTTNFSVTVNASPANGGAVTGGGTFPANSTVTVVATPASGFQFASWTETGSVVSTNASYSFVLTGNRTLVANFVQTASFTITLSASPGEGGTVSGAGTYPGGTARTVTATPASGYRFVNWTENGTSVSTSPNYTFTLTANRNLTANFEVSTAQGSASRVLPAGYVPGVAFTVTINVAPGTNVSAYAVEDTPPAGWTASNINNGGIWDSVNMKVKWGPFFDSTARALSYQVTPPSGASGVKNFAGIASFDGRSVQIAGNSSIDLAQGHPADYPNPDMRMDINEVTAYGSAWKLGTTWPLPPNPIDVNYVTRAGFLWKNGEVYHFDPTQQPPLWWVPGAAPGIGGRSFLVARRALSVQRSATGLAIRLLPLSRLGSAMPVSIVVEPELDVSSYAVEDRPPLGWHVSEINNGGVWDASNGTVKWGPFLDSVPRTFSYRATPLVGATKAGGFDGRASFDGASVAVRGAGAKLSRDSARNSFKQVAGSYYGLIKTDKLQSNASGSIKLDLNATGRFSAVVFYDGAKVRLLGGFALDGTFAGEIKPTKGNIIRVYLYLDLTANTGQLTGYVDDGANLPGLLAERRGYDAKRRPAPQAGRYHLSISPDDLVTANVAVNASGKVKVRGVRNDGSRFTQVSALSEAGVWPFYVGLRENGCALGFVTVQPAIVPAIDTSLIESTESSTAPTDSGVEF